MVLEGASADACGGYVRYEGMKEKLSQVIHRMRAAISGGAPHTDAVAPLRDWLWTLAIAALLALAFCVYGVYEYMRVQGAVAQESDVPARQTEVDFDEVQGRVEYFRDQQAAFEQVRQTVFVAPDTGIGVSAARDATTMTEEGGIEAATTTVPSENATSSETEYEE